MRLEAELEDMEQKITEREMKKCQLRSVRSSCPVGSGTYSRKSFHLMWDCWSGPFFWLNSVRDKIMHALTQTTYRCCKILPTVIMVKSIWTGPKVPKAPISCNLRQTQNLWPVQYGWSDNEPKHVDFVGTDTCWNNFTKDPDLVKDFRICVIILWDLNCTVYSMRIVGLDFSSV